MVLAALRAAKLECFVQKNKPMANLLKVVLVADHTVLPPDSADIKFLFVKDIIYDRGGGMMI